MMADGDDRALVPLATESAPDAPAVVRDIAASTLTSGYTLDQVIAVWLAENDEPKPGQEHSRTWRAYRDTLASFRSLLHRVGLDLDIPVIETLATLAQGWADEQRQVDRKTGRIVDRPITRSTYNHRLGVVSSFYDFARKRRMLRSDNPIDLLKRKRVQSYAHAEALDADDVARCLDAIDRTQPMGLRDYALLLLAFNTGRRLAELAAMRWGHLALHGAHSVTVTFPHAKGDKIMRDDLARPVADALLTWLRSYYGAMLAELPADAPVWVALTHAPTQGMGGQALGVRAIGYIYERRLKALGVTKAHSSRHTFAHQMRALGADVREIQQRLGHSSSATTERYLGELTSGHNPHAEALAARFVRHGKGT